MEPGVVCRVVAQSGGGARRIFFSDPFANVICDSTSDSHSNRCALFLSILHTSQTLLLVPARLHRRSRWRRGVQVEQNRVGKGKAMTRSVKQTNSTQGPEDAAGSRQNAACPCAASDRSTLITPAPPRLGVIVIVRWNIVIAHLGLSGRFALRLICRSKLNPPPLFITPLNCAMHGTLFVDT